MTPITMTSVMGMFAAEDAKRQPGPSNRLYLNVASMMPIGTNALLRLLAVDPSSLPYVVKYWITLKFQGIINSDHDTDMESIVKVPSMKTWELPDYILQAIAPYWRGSEEEKNVYARPYYHRPAYIWACMPVSLPFNEQQAPENPIRLVSFTKSIQEQIRQALGNPDLEYAPWDEEHGRDFRIVKGKQGDFPTYTQSQFAFKERSLSVKERAAIEQYGLPDLQAEIGSPPSEEQQAQIKAMYHASLAGSPFDNKLWGNNWRAFNSRFSNSTDAPAATTTRGAKPNAEEETAAILEKLRAKNARRQTDEAAD